MSATSAIRRTTFPVRVLAHLFLSTKESSRLANKQPPPRYPNDPDYNTWISSFAPFQRGYKEEDSWDQTGMFDASYTQGDGYFLARQRWDVSTAPKAFFRTFFSAP